MEFWRYLLAALVTVALCATLSPLAQALPVSPPSVGTTSRHRGQSVETQPSSVGSETLQENTKIPAREVRSAEEEEEMSGSVSAGDVTENSTSLDSGSAGCAAENSTQSNFAQCMEQCYLSHPPQEKINELREINFEEEDNQNKQVSFALSEWLENYHRWSYCKDWEPGNECEGELQQNIFDRLNDMKKAIKDVLGYNVAYNAMYYPRYLVRTASSLRVTHLKYNESTREWDKKYRH